MRFRWTGGKIMKLVCKAFLRMFATGLLILSVFGTLSAAVELTKAQAIARARSILRSNTSACSIRSIKSVTAVKVAAGWRVTAKIVMASSGSPMNETAVWTISQRNGAVAANQLTSEIANGCP